ncbi:MAG: hypothetical protein H6P98_1985 [Candidatus Aminicenantes bacterium]|nr:hypothetical protein [Candidatus Aminicenantes bacterium]
MKRTICLLSALLFLAAAASLASPDKSKVYYVCNCKDDCTCNTISKEPGKCPCGEELAGMHLLAIEKDTAVFCSCGVDCTCERSKEDPDKCGCGKPVKKISLKGKYVCACGDACKCGSISDKPGKCPCGTEMKKVE